MTSLLTRRTTTMKKIPILKQQPHKKDKDTTTSLDIRSCVARQGHLDRFSLLVVRSHLDRFSLLVRHGHLDRFSLLVVSSHLDRFSLLVRHSHLDRFSLLVQGKPGLMMKSALCSDTWKATSSWVICLAKRLLSSVS
ncbi:uncharacterized protein [Littorina saxatilis]|uniref:uncharacterized protein isoform X2 n=1 Tax=Littorina saxatilis TaxID=31220 RepID=UPI0038B4D68E